jgi:hypothetical protein
MAKTIQLRTAPGSGVWTDHSLRIQQRVFHLYASEFLAASTKTRRGLVRAHLLGHSLELLLKTYLLTRGTTAKQLKVRFGHDLEKLAKECKEAGLLGGRLSPELLADIGVFNAAYKSEAFRYFSLLHLLAPPRVPDLRRLSRYARSVSEALRAHLRAA